MPQLMKGLNSLRKLVSHQITHLPHSWPASMHTLHDKCFFKVVCGGEVLSFYVPYIWVLVQGATLSYCHGSLWAAFGLRD